MPGLDVLDSLGQDWRNQNGQTQAKGEPKMELGQRAAGTTEDTGAYKKWWEQWGHQFLSGLSEERRNKC